jgi:phosphate transport system protein
MSPGDLDDPRAALPAGGLEGGAMSDKAAHIVKSYSQELKRLRDLLVEMGGLVEAQLSTATVAVLDQDIDAATRTVEQDPAGVALVREVESFVIRLLALRQPVAGDLREIVAALKMTSDLERIGDYAANVAKRSIVLSQFNLPFRLTGLAHMARMVQEGLKLTIDAIGDADAEKAIQVWRSDQAVDDIYTAIFRELVTYMMEDPRNITPCTHLLFIAKNLERIGDHATNIAETIHYAATGETLPEARPKGDSANYAVIRPREDRGEENSDAGAGS